MIIHGDCLSVLCGMAAESVQMCVTSPPYFNLRDYGTAKWVGGRKDCDHRKVSAGTASIARSTLGPNRDGVSGQASNGHQQEGFKALCRKCGARREDKQIGLEETPEQYVSSIVDVFREVRRVLRPNGTLWLNLGDSYAGSWGNQGRKDTRGTQRPINGPIIQRLEGYPERQSFRAGNPQKNGGLAAKNLVGIPWRVAFALQADGWILRSDIIWAKPNPMPESVTDRPTKAHEYLFMLAKSPKYFYNADAIAEPANSAPGVRRDYGGSDGPRDSGIGRGRCGPGKNLALPQQTAGRRMVENVAKARAAGAAHDSPFGATRNRRTVWTITPKPFKGAHFAAFPPALVEPCILAGSRPGDTVLDPFSGAGTTVMVAAQLGREGLGIELNPEYIALSEARIKAVA